MATPVVDPNFYSDGAKKMTSEGLEVVSKIMAFIKERESDLLKMDPIERKKLILEFGPSKLFNQVHPIVFQYLATEGIFNANAFKRYVLSVFGKPKSQEDMEHIRKNRKFLYHHKNAQYALYYKYMLIDMNPNVKKSIIHGMYEEVVDALNADTDRMFLAYEKAEVAAKVVESEITEEKRKDLINLLKKQFAKQE